MTHLGEADPWFTERRRNWNDKPVLREIYADYHRRLDEACPPGRMLDIGGGSLRLESEKRPSIITLDILPFPGIDVAADAHRLPFADGQFTGIVMLDVLHHLQRPLDFFHEAARLLESGGRIAMVEPGMSLVSKQFYSRFHQEPVVMDADPFDDRIDHSSDDPFDSNQALPTLFFARKDRVDRFERTVPSLKVVSVRWLSLFAYPLSGGFKPWCLIPQTLVAPTLRLERMLLPVLGPVSGFRLMIVLEKR